VTPNSALVVLSLLANFLVLLHTAEDIVRGFEPDGLKHLQTYFTMGLWLYGTVALNRQRNGYIIMLLGGLLGTLVSIAHLIGAGLVGGRIANSDGKLLWVFPQVLLGVVASVAAVLAAQSLWRLRRGQEK
jgi:hypothetical protein